jgi:hypothetical protein
MGAKIKGTTYISFMQGYFISRLIETKRVYFFVSNRHVIKVNSLHSTCTTVVMYTYLYNQRVPVLVELQYSTSLNVLSVVRYRVLWLYKGADKSLAQPGRKQATATEVFKIIYLIYYHDWRNISTIYIYNKTSLKRNILTIK